MSQWHPISLQQNLAYSRPVRNIPVLDGDTLQHNSFTWASENDVGGKTNMSDCLHFLGQYTRGHPRDLVKGCQHLPPGNGDQRAKPPFCWTIWQFYLKSHLQIFSHGLRLDLKLMLCKHFLFFLRLLQFNTQRHEKVLTCQLTSEILSWYFLTS